MSTTPVTLNGTTYFVPQPGEAGPTYAQNLTNYLIALATAFPQTAGSVGFTALTSANANPATAGSIRLAHGDLEEWRNNANSGNLPLGVGQAGVGGVDDLSYNGILLTGQPAACYQASAIVAWTVVGAVVTGYNTALFADTDSAFNTGTGTYTVPTGKAGYYWVTGSLVAAAGAVSTSLFLQIRQNGSPVFRQDASCDVTDSQSVAVTGLLKCAVGDTLTIFQQSGVANAGVNIQQDNYILVKK